jgi:beta-glucanase (GH16 family)
MTKRVLFTDDFWPGPDPNRLDSSKWDYNHWEQNNNPSYLGLTQMRQELPWAQAGVARIRLDTWNGQDGKCFLGSEAITRQAFALPGGGGGIAFEADLKFEGAQGGMIAGFFTFQQFPPGADRDIHDEIDVEIITTNLAKVSTNVFAQESLKRTAHPLSIPVKAGTFSDFHTYRMEWFSDHVSWFLDGVQIRKETQHVPTKPQQLHLNLWGVPGGWGPSPGDPNGPPVGDPNFVPATRPQDNKAYLFYVRKVKVEQLDSPV